jgi:hypothetical protein
MNVTINILELASELAEKVVCAKFEDDDKEIYIDTNEGTIYTPQAQEMFEEWYDYYFDIIINLSEDGKDTLLGPSKVPN